MKTFAVVAVIALSSALVACGERNNPPIKTSKSDGEQVVQPTSSAPLAMADCNTPPNATPATHAGIPDAAAPLAPAALDTPQQKLASEANSARQRAPGMETEKAEPPTPVK